MTRNRLSKCFLIGLFAAIFVVAANAQTKKNSQKQYGRLPAKIAMPSVDKTAESETGIKENTITNTKDPYILQDGDVTIAAGMITATTLGNDIGHLIIPETLSGQTVIGIADRVFKQKGLTQLELPATIEILEERVFDNNQSLSEVNFEDLVNLHTIGPYILNDAIITDLDLSNCTNLQTIDVGAFFSCEIVTLELPNSLTSIGAHAFKHNDIEELNLGENITFIGGGAFNGNNVSILNGEPTDGIIYAKNDDGTFNYTKTISYARWYDPAMPLPQIPQNVEIIGNSTFANTGLSNMDFSNLPNLRIIEYAAFEYNYFNEIDFSTCPNLEYVGAYAFAASVQSSIILNDNIKFIGMSAFENHKVDTVDILNCTKLIEIEQAAFYTVFIDTSFAYFQLPQPNIEDKVFQHWLCPTTGKTYAAFERVSASRRYVAVFTPIGGEEYTLTFEVNDEDGTAIEGANITIGSSNLTTDANGVASIELPDGTYSYTIEKDGYVGQSSEVTIAGANATEAVSLASSGVEVYTLTFEVSDEDGAAIEGASIAVGYGNLTTDANGIATIELQDGTHDYTIEKDGFTSLTGTITIAGADLTEEATMHSDIGISEQTSDFALKLYPNPTNDVLHVQSISNEKLTYRVIDLVGRSVLNGELTGNGQINTAGLSSGIYTLVVYGSNQKAMRKFSKK